MTQELAMLELERAALTLGNVIAEMPGNMNPRRGWWTVVDQPVQYNGAVMHQFGRVGDVILNLFWLKSFGPQLIISIDDHPFDASTEPTMLSWRIRDVEQVQWSRSRAAVDEVDFDTIVEFGLQGCLETIRDNHTLHRVIAYLDSRSHGLFGSYFAEFSVFSEEQIYDEVDIPDELRLDPLYARRYFSELSERIELAH